MQILRRGVVALATMAILVPGMAAPAHALGRDARACSISYAYVGVSDTKGAVTWQGTAGGCDNVGVRAMYKTYNASPVYYTSWTYHSLSVKKSPGSSNIMVGGGHKVTMSSFSAFTTEFNT